MLESVGGLVVGVATVYLGNLITRGSPGARALAAARQELEVAGLLEDGDLLAQRLRDTARSGIERYLNPRGWETLEGKANTISLSVASVTTFVGLIMVAAEVETHDLSFWQSTGLGGLLGVLWHLMVWGIRRSLVRLLRRSP